MSLRRPIKIVERKPYLVHGIWFINLLINGIQFRRSTGTDDLEKAKLRQQEYVKHFKYGALPLIGQRSLNRFNTNKEWNINVENGLSHHKAWLSTIYFRTKDRSKKKSIPFTLTKEQLKYIALATNGKCALTDINFCWTKPNKSYLSPYSPSLDRIDPASGYIKNNCRLICYAINIAMSDWGEDVFFNIAEKFTKKYAGR